jgi:hypothetical protein
MQEAADRRGRAVAEIRDIDRIGKGNPKRENEQQQQAKRRQSAC